MSQEQAKPQIIVVEDETLARKGLADSADLADIEPILCKTLQEGMQELVSRANNGLLMAVITDLSMGNNTGAYPGWDIVKKAYELNRSLTLIVFTAYAKTQSVPYELNKLNPTFWLFDKNDKPKSTDELDSLLRKLRKSWVRSRELAYDADTRKTFEVRAKNYAKSSLPILILGETGTGKDLLAERIDTFYRENRPNAANIQIINCGALEPTLAFSELFGHTKGAFTDAGNHTVGKVLEASGYKAGTKDEEDYIKWLMSNKDNHIEERDGVWTLTNASDVSGTLFLDEVAALPQSVMPGLLRILGTNDVTPLGYHGKAIRVHCRIISATNEVSALKESTFRQDLFYRIAGAVLTLPPLRERNPETIEKFINDGIVWDRLRSKDQGLGTFEVESAALKFIKQLYLERADETAREYQLGNFRSLLNLLHRAALIARNENLISISAPIIKTAVDDGLISTVPEFALDQQNHIRQVFWSALSAQPDVRLFDESSRKDEVRDMFGLSSLKEWTKKYPTQTAEAFLHCNLVRRIAGSKRGEYYELREIEQALATGYGRGAWIGGTIQGAMTRDLVENAARTHGCNEDELSGKKISEIVKAVRLKDNIVTGTNR